MNCNFHLYALFAYDAEENILGSECACRFVGRLINLEEIPQYVQEYSRGNDVELWQIKYLKPRP